MAEAPSAAQVIEQAIGRRSDPDRLPGWTLELVITQGLGRLAAVGGANYVVRLDGRSSGPVFFVLTRAEYLRWQQVRESLGLATGEERVRARRAR